MPPHCPQCGAEVHDDTEVCPACGCKIALLDATARVEKLEEANAAWRRIDVDNKKLIAELKHMNARWKKAIEGLTPGGSEFVDDPERCAEHIRARCQYPKMILELRAENERLKADRNRRTCIHVNVAGDCSVRAEYARLKKAIEAAVKGGLNDTHTP